jgi:hypothetical protein
MPSQQIFLKKILLFLQFNCGKKIQQRDIAPIFASNKMHEPFF